MALNPGDLVFVGWDADNEDVAFLTTATISAGEVIYFTDTEWTGTEFAPGEQVIEWTVTEDIPPGQVLTIDMIPFFEGGPDAEIVNGSSPSGDPVGSVEYLRGGGLLAQSNEQLWAVQGSYDGTTVVPDPDGFISVISNEDVGVDGGPILDGTGLDATNGAVTIPGDEDFMVFDPTTALNGNTYTEPPEVLRDNLLELIGDPDNWITDDGGGNQNPGGGFTYDTGGSGALPTPLGAGQVTTLYFTGSQVAFVDAIDDVGSGSSQLSTSFTFEATDLIEIDIVSGDIQGPPLDGELDYDQIIFTRVSVIRDGIQYDLDVNDGSKIKETGGPDSGAKEQGDSFFTTNDDDTLDDPEFGSSISGTLAFSIDETFIDSDGNPVDPIIARSRPDLDTNGDGDPDSGTPFNNENFNIGTAVSPPPIPCFVRGSTIETRDGPRPVEDLKVGDYVRTLDNGLQQIRWIGSVTVSALGKLAPIIVAKGALGNTQELRVSREHRILLTGWKAELLFGLDEALVAAKHLCNGDTIYRHCNAQPVEYFHLMFDQHELLLSSGIWSESYYFDPLRTEAMSGPVEAELRRLFPDEFQSSQRMKFARPTLKSFKVKALV